MQRLSLGLLGWLVLASLVGCGGEPVAARKPVPLAQGGTPTVKKPQPPQPPPPKLYQGARPSAGPAELTVLVNLS